jgi:hypothetical protein
MLERAVAPIDHEQLDVLAREARQGLWDRPNARRLDMHDFRVVPQQAKDSPYLGVAPAGAEIVH